MVLITRSMKDYYIYSIEKTERVFEIKNKYVIIYAMKEALVQALLRSICIGVFL